MNTTWLKTCLVSAIVLMITPLAFGQTTDEPPSSRYMGGSAELATAPNGAIVNKYVLDQLPKTAWTSGPEIILNT